VARGTCYTRGRRNDHKGNARRRGTTAGASSHAPWAPRRLFLVRNKSFLLAASFAGHPTPYYPGTAAAWEISWLAVRPRSDGPTQSRLGGRSHRSMPGNPPQIPAVSCEAARLVGGLVIGQALAVPAAPRPTVEQRRHSQYRPAPIPRVPTPTTAAAAPSTADEPSRPETYCDVYRKSLRRQ
jgi:hypothetical protein